MANADGGHDAVDEWPMLTNDVRMFQSVLAKLD